MVLEPGKILRCRPLLLLPISFLMNAGDVVLLNSGELSIVSRVKVRQVQNGGALTDEQFMYLLSNPSVPVPITAVKHAIGNLQSLFSNRDPVLTGVCK